MAQVAMDRISYEDLYRRWEKGNWSAMELDFSEDCDERGPPRWHAPACQSEERVRGGPRSCCTLDWI